MTTRIAFLRAVNVGARKVKMARLLDLFGQLGYDDVWTHINSGNVVFDTAGSRAQLERVIESTLERDFGFECTTMVRTANEVRKGLAELKITRHNRITQPLNGTFHERFWALDRPQARYPRTSEHEH